jgi:hypothetical protein
VRALVERQRAREAVLDGYAYEILSVREELDAEGRVRSRHTQRFEATHVRGRPVRRLVAEDGRALPAGRQAKEDERARERAADLRAGKAARERAAIPISAILERYDFRAVAREVIDGRPAVVLDFAPRPGDRDIQGDAVLRRLSGRLWVDEAEQQVVRADVRNTEPIKIGWGLGASVSRVESRSEFRKMEGVGWVPWRSETRAEGRKLLLKSFRTRVTLSYSGFRAVRAAPGG